MTHTNSQDDPRSKLTDRYNREAYAYRDLWAPILRLAALKLLRELAATQPTRIVDVGTGVGFLVPDLQATFPGASILGIDRSPGMLALVSGETPCAVMDAAQLGFRPACVDLVLMVFMLFHLAKPVDGLREARRVLGQGGRAGCLTWAGEFESPATRIWTKCLDAHGASEADPTTQTRHDPVNTPEKMETLLHRAGFTSVRSWTDDLISSIDLDHLIRLRTSMGAAKPRFDSLTRQAQKACVEDAIRRMERLAPEGFVTRGSVVYAVASV